MKTYDVAVNDRTYEIRSSTIAQAVKSGIEHHMKRHKMTESGTLRVTAAAKERPAIVDTTAEDEAPTREGPARERAEATR